MEMIYGQDGAYFYPTIVTYIINNSYPRHNIQQCQDAVQLQMTGFHSRNAFTFVQKNIQTDDNVPKPQTQALKDTRNSSSYKDRMTAKMHFWLTA